MQEGDIQIYETPARRPWKSPTVWLIVLSLLVVAFGMYVIPSLL